MPGPLSAALSTCAHATQVCDVTSVHQASWPVNIQNMFGNDNCDYLVEMGKVLHQIKSDSILDYKVNNAVYPHHFEPIFNREKCMRKKQ